MPLLSLRAVTDRRAPPHRERRPLSQRPRTNPLPVRAPNRSTHTPCDDTNPEPFHTVKTRNTTSMPSPDRRGRHVARNGGERYRLHSTAGGGCERMLRECNSRLWKTLLTRDQTRPRTEVDLDSAQTTEHSTLPGAHALRLLEVLSTETTKVASARVANVALAARSVSQATPKQRSIRSRK